MYQHLRYVFNNKTKNKKANETINSHPPPSRTTQKKKLKKKTIPPLRQNPKLYCQAKDTLDILK